MLQSIKLNGSGDVESLLMTDMDMQSLNFVHLSFGLTLVQYFLTMLRSLCFGMVVHILCQCVLEVCDLLYDFDFYRGLQLRDCNVSQKKLWTLKQV